MGFRIISGGQAGAEQGAIDAAIDLGVKYARSETSDDYSVESQIEGHIFNSNGTVVFYNGHTNGRIATAIKTAVLHGCPCMLVDFSTDSIEAVVTDLTHWIDRNRITRLYVTGLNDGEDQRIYNNTRAVVSRALEGIRCCEKSG